MNTNCYNNIVKFKTSLILTSCNIFTGDRPNMWSDCNCVNANGINIHRLAIVSRLAARSIFSLYRS